MGGSFNPAHGGHLHLSLLALERLELDGVWWLVSPQNPLKAAAAAIVFGACDALQLSLQIFGTRVPPQLLLALPYAVTILAISGLFGGKAVQPAALMSPYVKD